MRKILCVLLAAALTAALISCGDSSAPEITTATTGSGEPVESTADKPADTTASDPAEPEDSTKGEEPTAGPEETTAAFDPETTPQTEPEETTRGANPEPSKDKPVITIVSGDQSVACMLVEQSAGIVGGFDLTEDYGELPVLSGTSFSLAEPERSDIYFASYMLYDSNFESYGTVMMNDDLLLVDSAFGTGRYYIRIAVNIGSWFDYTDAYYAYAALDIQ